MDLFDDESKRFTADLSNLMNWFAIIVGLLILGLIVLL